jgi:phosphatidate cytidylyltransferase
MHEIRLMGLSDLFFPLFVIWATDSGAYFIGKAIGKTKLWPEISPNKTIEGSLGGVICAIVVAVILSFVLTLNYSVIYLIFVAILVSVFGQIGDLVQSAYKRHFGVKDSGKILPGHGGILDRCDSWIFTFPIVYFLFVL